MKNKKNLLLIFGGRSIEHEVSIVTGLQTYHWLNQKKYQIFPIYLDKKNQAYLCSRPKKKNYRQIITKTLQQDKKINFSYGGIIKKGLLQRLIPVEAAILATHGGDGENGNLQGLLNFYQIPYTSSDVIGSALGIDKVISKIIAKSLGHRVVPYIWFFYQDFKREASTIITEIDQKLTYPLFIKPARGGSSIGIEKVNHRRELGPAINRVAKLDNKILVESEINNVVDINCAVMGNQSIMVSPCEQPVTDDQFLSFAEKYLKGGKNKGMAGASRIIPAPIEEKISQAIQSAAKDIFQNLVFDGMVRIDFLYQEKEKRFYFNEVNTIPGSLSYYLWQEDNLSPQKMIEKLIKLAKEKQIKKNRQQVDFSSSILDQK